MTDRHEKWTRVEPGTVIPAGQPYRREDGDEAAEGVVKGLPHGFPVPRYNDWFVDSSWKPPLDLPTTPTWGIAVHNTFDPGVGEWRIDGEEFWDHEFSKSYKTKNVIDFIPLTDEQVARIEAAR